MSESHHSVARDLAVDAAKASPVAGYAASIAAGVDWPTVGAALMAVYTGLLILEKLWRLGVFARIRKAVLWLVREAQEAWRFLRDRP